MIDIKELYALLRYPKNTEEVDSLFRCAAKSGRTYIRIKVKKTLYATLQGYYETRDRKGFLDDQDAVMITVFWDV
jgi:hypothetical protein